MLNLYSLSSHVTPFSECCVRAWYTALKAAPCRANQWTSCRTRRYERSRSVADLNLLAKSANWLTIPLKNHNIFPVGRGRKVAGALDASVAT